MRRLTTRLLLAAVAVAGGYAAARRFAPVISGAAEGSPQLDTVARAAPTNVTGASGDGERLVRTVLDKLERRPNISARVRQSVRLEHQGLAAEGQFWQRNVGNQRRTRWQLTTLVDDNSTFVTQVFDGDHVWTDRRSAGLRKVTRIDVTRIRREFPPAGSATGRAGEGAETPVELLARGGLSQLIAELQQCFEFAAPQTMRRGDRIVLGVIGAWRPERLAQNWPGLTEASGQWPMHLPHHVLLHIDNDDLFPYYIEYRGGGQRSLIASATAHFPAYDPLASVEFIDVQFTAAMDEGLFEFSPGEIEWHDATNLAIEQLRRACKPPVEPKVARLPGAWQ